LRLLRHTTALCAALLVGAAPAHAITNGTLDTGDPAVATFGACTGTLIAPRVLLTAAHCVWSLDVLSQHAVFGDAIHATMRQERLILEGRVHPDFDPVTLDNDIALVLLDLPPDGIDPLPMNTTPIDDALVGSTVRLVGFGVTMPNAPPENFGTKRQGTASLRAYLANGLVDDAMPSSACQGDSGGAALLTLGGVEVLAGVISRGDLACGNFGVATRVDRYVTSFIQPYLLAVQPGGTPVGGSCASSEQCVSNACATATDDPNLHYCTADCSADNGCPAGMGCIDRRCQYALPTPGAFGSACDRNSDCDGWTCAAAVEGGARICTVLCVAGAEMACAEGYACAASPSVSGQSVCLPAAPSTADTGCQVASAAAPSPTGLGLLALALVLARRRRSGLLRRRRVLLLRRRRVLLRGRLLLVRRRRVLVLRSRISSRGSTRGAARDAT
jgi:hypothetical protein